MASSHTALPPSPPFQPELVADLRSDLAGAGYDVANLGQIIGQVAIAALDREEPLPARDAAAASTEPAALLMRLFALGQEVSRAEVDRALPTVGADGVTHLGLVRAAGAGPADAMRALVDLRPVSAGPASLWLASDLGEGITGRPLDPGHVLGVGGAGRTLAEITVDTPARRALDLGTGCGIQALNVAGSSDEVVATDLSRRALAFAGFNATLNGVDLDLRAGDLLEPVAGEAFDLIVSNPPFVITPRTGDPAMTYRDGGRTGDDLIADLFDALPQYLAPGGVAQFLGNWEIPAGARWSERVEAWAARCGVDVWVIQREVTDPAQYAETWLRDGGLTPERDREAWERGYRDYLRDFAARDTDGIGFGYVMLRRPAAPRAPWRRFEDLRHPLPGAAGRAIAATLTAADRLHASDQPQSSDQTQSCGQPQASKPQSSKPQSSDPAREAMLQGRYVVGTDVTEQRHYRPGQAHPQIIQLHQGGGLARTMTVPSHAAALVGACDGELTAVQILNALAVLTDEPVGDITAQVLPVLQDLYLDGFLHPAE